MSRAPAAPRATRPRPSARWSSRGGGGLSYSGRLLSPTPAYSLLLPPTLFSL